MNIISMLIVGLLTATIMSSLLGIVPFYEAFFGGALASLVVDLVPRKR